MSESSGGDVGGGEREPNDGRDPSLSEEEGGAVRDCVEGLDGASMVRGLRPALSVTAVSFVALDETHHIQWVLEQFGEPCETDAVGSSCILEIEEQMTGFYTAGSETPNALLVSEDGESSALGYIALREFLGEIDTANEAAVIAWSEGWSASCLTMRETRLGWSIPDDQGCSGDDGRVMIFRDGSVSHSAHCDG